LSACSRKTLGPWSMLGISRVVTMGRGLC
jgi:hypothetical protein